MYTVYMHTSKTSNKKYIGITCQEPWTKRFNGDGSGYKNCVHFWNAIKLYGWEDFVHEIIDQCETEKEANDLERYYIKLYKTNNDEYGYNIKEGGDHQIYPQEIRDKISKSLKGKVSPLKGKPMSDETKEKIRKAQKGRPLTPEHAENCKKAMREYFKTHSPSHSFSREDYAKARESTMKKIRVCETGQVFNSMTECANYFNVYISNLSRAIKEKRKYKGYHFEKVCSQKPDGQSKDVASSEAKWRAPVSQGEDMT